MIRSNRTARPGFTLIEMMISATITIIIMTILSICFRTSMSAMSSMRAQGDAADQLRAFSATIKRDLTASRSLPTEQSAAVNNRGRRLSDYRFHQGAAPPATGYTRIVSTPSIYEGNDSSLDSYRNATSSMQFTSVLSGAGEGELYTAASGGNMYTSEAAEIEYFTVPSGQFTSGGGGNTVPLFNLFRHQRLVAMDSLKQSQFPTNDPEAISTFVQPGPITLVNTMNTIAANTAFRSATGTPYTGRVGDDIILSNVLSFEIKPTWIAPVGTSNPRQFGFSTAAIDTPDIFNATTNAASSDYPYDSLGAEFPGNTFDTAFPTVNNPRVRVNAVQIRVRIYDPKVKTARQMTMIIEM